MSSVIRMATITSDLFLNSERSLMTSALAYAVSGLNVARIFKFFFNKLTSISWSEIGYFR